MGQESRGKWDVTATKLKLSFWSDENFLKLEKFQMILQPCEYAKNHCIVHLKWVSVWYADYFSMKLSINKTTYYIFTVSY